MVFSVEAQLKKVQEYHDVEELKCLTSQFEGRSVKEADITWCEPFSYVEGKTILSQMKRKRVLRFAVIILVVAVAGIAGSLAFGPDQKAEVFKELLESLQTDNLLPEPVVHDTDASNWNVFRSENYGLAFNYPRDWQIDGGEQESKIPIQVSIVSPDSYWEDIYFGRGVAPAYSIWESGANFFFEIRKLAPVNGPVSGKLRACLEPDGVEKQLEFLTYPWLKCVEKNPLDFRDTKEATLINISGQAAIMYETLDSRSSQYDVNIRLFNKRDDSLIVITFSSAADEILSNILIFNAILSTIEFDS